MERHLFDHPLWSLFQSSLHILQIYKDEALPSKYLVKQQHQNKLFNSLPALIWGTSKGEHRYPDRGQDPYPPT